MKLTNGDSILAGVAEVSVDKLIALEKSVTDKDQTIGALRENIKNLETKVEDTKAESFAKQAMVIIQKGGDKTKGISSYRCNCGYYYDSRFTSNCPNCGVSAPITSEVKEYKNLDTVIEDIRKEESKKLGLDFAVLDKSLNELKLEKIKAENTSNFTIKGLEETLKVERKEKADEIQKSKETIRKHMTTLVDGLTEDLEATRDELKKVKKDKSDDAVEEARKQEIIDLKERITELEKPAVIPNFGWFKTQVYNWLDVDGRALVTAKRENLEKKARIDQISRDYPKNKSFWTPGFMQGWANPFSWMF